MRCWGLHGLTNTAYSSRFLSVPCPVLHRTAFAVVSEWCQGYPHVCLAPSATGGQAGPNYSVTLDTAMPVASMMEDTYVYSKTRYPLPHFLYC